MTSWENDRVGVGTLFGQIGHLTPGDWRPPSIIMDFRGGYCDHGIVVRFLEIPSLDISRFGVDLIVGSLRATNRSTFSKTEKFEIFFFKKFRKVKFRKFLKKDFKLFSF